MITLGEFWSHGLGLRLPLGPWIAFPFLILFVLLPLLTLMALGYRRFASATQVRIGPNLAGLKGAGQIFADTLKLIQKRPGLQESKRRNFWFSIYWFTVFSTLALLPIGALWAFLDTSLVTLLPIWIFLVAALAWILFGLEEHSLEGLYGGLRLCAQGLSAAFTATLCVITVGMHAGGFSWKDVLAHQSASPLHWTVFSGPLLWLTFILYLLSGPQILGLKPLEGSSTSAEIHRGINHSLSGLNLGLYQMASLYGVFFWALTAVVLFCGGGLLPDWIQGPLTEGEHWFLLGLAQWILILAKSLLIMFLYSWLTVLLPRLRTDQLTHFNWRTLGFLSVLAFIGDSLWLWVRGIV
jgi:NADH:ubiquinone oxidoreductase subunit H